MPARGSLLLSLVFGILSGILVILTILLLGDLGIMPNRDELVGKTLLFWGTILLLYAYIAYTVILFVIRLLIISILKKIHKAP